MDNIVINRLCNALVAKSIVALKFNFQGVGGSQGTFNVGKERSGDAQAAISLITGLREVDPARVGLVGYSAGAAWGLTEGYQNSRIRVLCAISPPLSLFDFKILCDCHKPKLMISGSQDIHIPENVFLNFCKQLSEPVEYELIKGADHSLQGYEGEIAENVAAFFSRTLN
jgi:uncharacterized protein